MRAAAVLAAASTLLVAGCGDGDGGQPAAPATGHDPIVFVHGYSGGAGDWDVMVDRFAAGGWPEEALPEPRTYSSTASNADLATAIGAEVDRVLAATGAAKVDLVTFSMGGLSSRHYVRFGGGAAKVDAWVSLGGPNHGTAWASTCSATPCREMRPGSPFLQRLNAGDETPGGVRHATWTSPCDAIIRPPRSTALRGARNTTTACLRHVALLGDATVHAQVRDFVR